MSSKCLNSIPISNCSFNHSTRKGPIEKSAWIIWRIKVWNTTIFTKIIKGNYSKLNKLFKPRKTPQKKTKKRNYWSLKDQKSHCIVFIVIAISLNRWFARGSKSNTKNTLRRIAIWDWNDRQYNLYDVKIDNNNEK